MEILQTHNFIIPYNSNIKINALLEFVTIKNIEYYQITYKYGDNNIPSKFNEELKCINKEPILKNELTQKLVEFLLLDDITLSKITGTITPLSYKKSILLSLAYFIE